MTNSPFIIRPATAADCTSILNLINELALYEKEPQQVTNTVEQLMEDGFGENPIWFAYVAELNNTLIGFALASYVISTWKGRSIWLDDLYVQPSHRNSRVGISLLTAIVEHGKRHNCKRIQWCALDWNQMALDFYQSVGAVQLSEWTMCRMTEQKMDEFLRSVKDKPNIVRVNKN